MSSVIGGPIFGSSLCCMCCWLGLTASRSTSVVCLCAVQAVHPHKEHGANTMDGSKKIYEKKGGKGELDGKKKKKKVGPGAERFTMTCHPRQPSVTRRMVVSSVIIALAHTRGGHSTARHTHTQTHNSHTKKSRPSIFNGMACFPPFSRPRSSRATLCHQAPILS